MCCQKKKKSIGSTEGQKRLSTKHDCFQKKFDFQFFVKKKSGFKWCVKKKIQL